MSAKNSVLQIWAEFNLHAVQTTQKYAVMYCYLVRGRVQNFPA